MADTAAQHLVTSSFPSVTSTTINADLSSEIYPSVTYTDAEKQETSVWLSSAPHFSSSSTDAAKLAERLSQLNTHLSTRTTVLGTKPSIADIALYAHVAQLVKSWSPDERTGENGYHHIVRWTAFVQSSPVVGLKIADSDKVPIDETDVRVPVKQIDPKAEKERKKKEKEAAAAAAAPGGAPATQTAAAQATEMPIRTKEQSAASTTASETPAPRKEKKEKAPKQPKPAKAPAVEKPLTPSQIDLRVGHILKAERHPNADSLYVSTIACGDAAGTENTSEYEGQIVRTVCSGLNGLVPLEEMQGRKVVTVCNLKPVTMRGIKSCAMVLAASPREEPGHEGGHTGPVELVDPPSDAAAGVRCTFAGWEEGEPDAVLNPKKKVWETCQVGFTTLEDGSVAFESGVVEQLKEKKDVGVLRASGKVCTVKTLKGATVR